MPRPSSTTPPCSTSSTAGASTWRGSAWPSATPREISKAAASRGGWSAAVGSSISASGARRSCSSEPSRQAGSGSRSRRGGWPSSRRAGPRSWAGPTQRSTLGGGGALVQEGRHPKFVTVIDEITFSGRVAAAEEREILYVTERCVFRLGEQGLELAEGAPGIDIEHDILARLPFPLAVGQIRPMDPAIFRPAPMGLRAQLLDIRIEDRI